MGVKIGSCFRTFLLQNKVVDVKHRQLMGVLFKTFLNQRHGDGAGPGALGFRVIARTTEGAVAVLPDEGCWSWSSLRMLHAAMLSAFFSLNSATRH